VAYQSYKSGSLKMRDTAAPLPTSLPLPGANPRPATDPVSRDATDFSDNEWNTRKICFIGFGTRLISIGSNSDSETCRFDAYIHATAT
jgi:hypothetical protein